MRILVTGGAGYIGSACVEALLNEGHEVSVLDNLSEGHRAAIDPRADFHHTDLADRPGIDRVLQDSKADSILHFAANALVGESMANPGKYFRNNVACGINLLDAAVAAGVRKVIFSSTCATFGVPDRVPIDESTPQRPVNPYGESKWMFERILQWYRQIHGIETVVFRYFNAAGATGRLGEHHRVETHLIPNLLKVALGQKEFAELYGTDYPTPDGTCIRDYIHVSDLAAAHILALPAGRSGFFNLGNGDGSSVREVISACEKVSGCRIPVLERPRRPGDPPRLIASAEKAARELGWRPRIPSLTDIVASAWEWHRNHPDGYSE